MVLKQLGMASVSIQAGVEGFLELEPNSNTRFLSGRTVHWFIATNFWLLFAEIFSEIFQFSLGFFADFLFSSFLCFVYITI